MAAHFLTAYVGAAGQVWTHLEGFKGKVFRASFGLTCLYVPHAFMLH